MQNTESWTLREAPIGREKRWDLGNGKAPAASRMSQEVPAMRKPKVLVTTFQVLACLEYSHNHKSKQNRLFSTSNNYCFTEIVTNFFKELTWVGAN